MSNQTLREKPIPAFSVVNVRPDCEYHVGTEWPFRMYYFVELGSSAISELSSAESVWGWRSSERATVVRQVWGRQVTQVACFPGAPSSILQLGDMDEAKWGLCCTVPPPPAPRPWEVKELLWGELLEINLPAWRLAPSTRFLCYTLDWFVPWVSTGQREWRMWLERRPWHRAVGAGIRLSPPHLSCVILRQPFASLYLRHCICE